RHHRHGAAVLRPGALVRTERLGTLLAPAYRLHPAGIDTARLEIVARRIGPAVAERQVILAGAALVGMALDRDAHVRVAVEPGGLRVEGALRRTVERIGI